MLRNHARGTDEPDALFTEINMSPMVDVLLAIAETSEEEIMKNALKRVLGAGDLVESFVVALAGVVPHALIRQQGGTERDEQHQIRCAVAAQVWRPPVYAVVSRRTQGVSVLRIAPAQ